MTCNSHSVSLLGLLEPLYSTLFELGLELDGPRIGRHFVENFPLGFLPEDLGKRGMGDVLALPRRGCILLLAAILGGLVKGLYLRWGCWVFEGHVGVATEQLLESLDAPTGLLGLPMIADVLLHGSEPLCDYAIA